MQKNLIRSYTVYVAKNSPREKIFQITMILMSFQETIQNLYLHLMLTTD